MKRLLTTLTMILLMAVGVLAISGVQDRDGQEKKLSLDQITEIILERKGCFLGTCPVYTVSLRKDGIATYTGKKYVERIGQYRGKIYEHEFDRLAKWLELQGYFKLQDKYAKGWSDAEEAITSIVRGGGRKDVYTRNTEEPPIELWGINAAIDGVVTRIQWEKVQK